MSLSLYCTYIISYLHDKVNSFLVELCTNYRIDMICILCTLHKYTICSVFYISLLLHIVYFHKILAFCA
nr:MAG TPA: hypothetical protein [Caudoviricetes sp.]